MGTRLQSVYFINQNIGWVIGHFDTILKTTDGGTTWNSQPSGLASSLNSIQFSDNNTGRIAAGGG